MSPLKALRLRCIDCCADQPSEVRLCTAVTCPSCRSAWAPIYEADPDVPLETVEERIAGSWSNEITGPLSREPNDDNNHAGTDAASYKRMLSVGG
jgi:hypothetical protein